MFAYQSFPVVFLAMIVANVSMSSLVADMWFCTSHPFCILWKQKPHRPPNSAAPPPHSTERVRIDLIANIVLNTHNNTEPVTR